MTKQALINSNRLWNWKCQIHSNIAHSNISHWQLHNFDTSKSSICSSYKL